MSLSSGRREKSTQDRAFCSHSSSVLLLFQQMIPLWRQVMMEEVEAEDGRPQITIWRTRGRIKNPHWWWISCQGSFFWQMIQNLYSFNLSQWWNLVVSQASKMEKRSWMEEIWCYSNNLLISWSQNRSSRWTTKMFLCQQLLIQKDLILHHHLLKISFSKPR